MSEMSLYIVFWEMIHHHCCLRCYFWLPFSFVFGNQMYNIVSLDIYLPSFQYCFLFTIARLGPTNMAAVNSRELQKPLAENNRMRYPVLFWDQWMNNKAIWPILHFTEHSQSKEDIHMYWLIDCLKIEAVRKLSFFASPMKTNL